MLTVVVYEHDHLFNRRSRSAAAKKADAERVNDFETVAFGL
jgi:hypothetical protein